MYTVPFTTTGFAASEPAYSRLVAAWPESWNDHASLSLDTLAPVITEPAASLVLARSPFGYGHDPDGVAAPGSRLLVGAGWPELQPAASSAKAATASRPGKTRLYGYVLAVIRLTSFKVIS